MGEGRGLLVAKLLIVHINNNATGMLIHLKLGEAYHSVASQGTCSDETRSSVDAWNPRNIFHDL